MAHAFPDVSSHATSPTLIPILVALTEADLSQALWIIAESTLACGLVFGGHYSFCYLAGGGRFIVSGGDYGSGKEYGAANASMISKQPPDRI
jgi:hypothetical protein